jgi:hypothetical protein
VRYACGLCGWETSCDLPIPDRDVIIEAEWTVHTSTVEHVWNLNRWNERDPEILARVQRVVKRRMEAAE